MRLVLLHAFPLDARMWRDLRDLIPGGTLAPTLYRLGDSIGQWAARVLEQAGQGPLVVVGCSMGGSCALEMAQQAGDRIAALVLIGTNPGHRPEPDQRDGFLATLREGGAAAIWNAMVAQFFGPDADPVVVASARAAALDQHPADLARAVTAFHSRPDLTGVLQGWQRRVTVVVGDQDRTTGDAVGRATRMAASAVHGQLRVVRGAGHLPNLERPTGFTSIVRENLQAVTRDGGAG
jgi:pimeloyl-ACP methyl ester carboxylesterase